MKSNMESVPSESLWKPASTNLLLAVLALSVLVAAVTVDMVTPVLALIAEQLAVSEAQVSWVVSGIALVLAVGVPLYGRMSDFIELRTLYCSAVAILCAGSLLCAVAAGVLGAGIAFALTNSPANNAAINS
ncbi:MFS transporter [Gordoniibacillus kamchatkensis]|uniref:MFS transporter n=1 Tax=Gordoniibacillus kamchatkensis TaxID=1590651 RepID=UPI000697B9D1